MLHAIDARDWARVREAFADTVRADYASLTGAPAADTPADALVAAWRGMLPGFDATQHLTGPFVTIVASDRAEARCAVTATHRLGPVQGGPSWIVKGHYAVTLARTPEPRGAPGAPGGAAPPWRITALTLHTTAVEGDLGLPDQARARTATGDATPR